MLEEVMKYGCLNAANVVFRGCMANMCVSLFVLEYTLCEHIVTKCMFDNPRKDLP